MPVYVTLCKSTAEGTKGLKESKRYVEEGEKDAKDAGGRILAAYALMGRYDYIYITEFPDQKSALKALFRTAQKGRVSPETFVAIPLAEFLESVKEA